MEWLGVDYSSQDEQVPARSLLERAYQLSRSSADPGVRASGSCALGVSLARDENLERAETLIQDGLRELPDEPEYALDRVNCLRLGSEVSRQRGEASEEVHRMEVARQKIRVSPFDSDALEMSISLDLASAYSEAGQDRQALSEFQRAAALTSSLGRDETQTAVVLYNNWALELDRLGRPLEAERLYRRGIDVSRDSLNEEAVSPMVLNNYARVLRELDHLPEAADYGERAYDKALKTGDELVVSQSLLERSRIYLAQHDTARSESMVAKVEPKLHKELPPGHYGFAAIPRIRAMIALENHDPQNALHLMDEAIAMIQASMKGGHAGGYVLPNLYTERSAIDLALGRVNEAEGDATQALAALHGGDDFGDASSNLGDAILARARALAALGKTTEARAAASHALTQLQGSLGPDHPDTQTARSLTE